jgi:hypothetical protein
VPNGQHGRWRDLALAQLVAESLQDLNFGNCRGGFGRRQCQFLAPMLGRRGAGDGPRRRSEPLLVADLGLCVLQFLLASLDSK